MSESQNQELMAVSPNQGQEGQKSLINTEHSGDGSSEKKGENKKLVRKKQYRVTVTEVHQMHPYFWGSL